MSKLYLVPTPIGNLEDITLRALRILKEVALILAEDTRNSGKLLQHYQIKTTLQAYHAHNEHSATAKVIAHLKQGNTAALVTDAGTPGISDPGFLLVRECLKEGIAVECLPGATAFVPALVNSGLPCDRFCFEGFLPHQKGRQTRLKALAEEPRTMVLYESPHRLLKTLQQLAEYLGAERPASVSRELTKLFEENARGTLAQLIAHFGSKTIKGEMVIVVGGREKETPKRS
ncbi:16S rRNA (cytidine(1402)-2'-O)-methyltransferase [Sphingobacteriales bacterium UPWRP_1]|nr:16S rRNA (cytidine(1402)-2'-O)-methyltransferase [Sphingobacteriales bacterium TSM_CSM]PSJ77793.1 16S rRNA (cytidine(1402)-2'-O)-methyltransferase [Sphingobacteriales bacterium UPWRP_1]